MKSLFTIDVVPVMFIIGGVIFLWVEHYLKDRDPTTLTLDDISYRQAGIIGFAQIFALVPGTSRAGSTIVGSLLAGVSRTASAEYSFLLALPVMVAASGLDLIEHYQDFTGEQAMPLLVGFAVSYLSAWVVMKVFLAFLSRFTFRAFGLYRIVFGVALLLWLHA
ncbi:undecaprenyl-diphosphate phosphatase [Vibrio olivae]